MVGKILNGKYELLELVGKGGKYAKLFEIQSCWYRDGSGGSKESSGRGEQTNEI